VRLRRSGFEGPMALYVFAIMGSLVANSQRVAAVSGEVYKKLPFFASFFILFYIIVSVVRRARDIDFLVRVLVNGGAVLAVFAVIESRTGYNVFDHLSSVIPFLHLNVAAIPNIEGRGGRLRVFASAQHSIALGALFAMLLPLAIYRALAYRQQLWWLAAFLLILGALATGSRTAIVMFGVQAIVFFLLRASAMRRTWIAIIPALLLVHIAMPGALGTIRSSFFPQGGIIAQQQDASVGSGRLATLGPALHSEFHNQLVGEGFGTRVTQPTELVPVVNGPILDDEWLGILLETGILGAFSLGWIFVRFTRRTGHVAKRDLSPRGWLLTCMNACVLSFGVGMAFYDAFGFYQTTFMVFICLGLGVATLLCPEHEWVELAAVERTRARFLRPVPAARPAPATR